MLHLFIQYQCKVCLCVACDQVKPAIVSPPVSKLHSKSCSYHLSHRLDSIGVKRTSEHSLQCRLEPTEAIEIITGCKLWNVLYMAN